MTNEKELKQALVEDLRTDERTQVITKAFYNVVGINGENEEAKAEAKAEALMDYLTDEQKAPLKEVSDVIYLMKEALEHGGYLLDSDEYAEKEADGRNLEQEGYVWSDELDSYVKLG